MSLLPLGLRVAGEGFISYEFKSDLSSEEYAESGLYAPKLKWFNWLADVFVRLILFFELAGKL